ncbi:flagellar assembly protein FliW [Brevibacillus fluminis]|uniref:flagellar assembly protein FliW n=1 Tax=Brevibacillus fluminis TaxID=511487 RepID=UPI003F8CD631
MRIQTPLFGEIEIEEKQIVTFSHGIPGFEEETEYVFLPLDDSQFVIMQSVRSALYFIVVNPFPIYVDYHFEIPRAELTQLQLESEKDVVVYNIVVLRDELEESTVNMQAPLIVNIRSMKGKQIVLNQFQVKQPLFPNGIHVTNG